VLGQIEQGIVRGHVVVIPAKAEANDLLGRAPGEYLWDDPKGYNYGQFLRARERETSPMMWSALYQQRPAPEEGDYFKAEWLREYQKLPPHETLHFYGASDYAVTADGGDYTVHIVVAVDPQSCMYVVDLWRQQASSDIWVETLCDLVLKWKPLEWAEETGQIKSGVGPFLERRLRDREARVYRRQFPTRGDKAVRAQSIRGRMAMDGLYLPAGAPWIAEFRRELLTFDAGVHDDIVDSLGLIGQLLDHVRPGQVPEQKKPIPKTPTYTALPDGRIVADMTVFEIVEAKRKQKERDA
jgi:predicted phage terminase large subunit-like protein